VDDQADVLAVAAETLSDLGYAPELAGDAAEALRRLAAVPDIAILFSDIVMPGGMNGIALAREARRLYPGLRILLTTGYAAAALNGTETLPDGVTILGKPYRDLELGRRLRQMLDAP
jgi:CheY-like chemotaxis protein